VAYKQRKKSLSTTILFITEFANKCGESFTSFPKLVE